MAVAGSLTAMQKHLAPAVARLTSLTMKSGRGAWVETEERGRLLDFTMGIGVTNLGHNHPAVVDAIKRQADDIVHAQVGIGYSRPMLSLIEKLLPLTAPHKLDTYWFMSSGAEAVEAAMKLARHATGRNSFVVMQGSYHGRTVGTMALTTSKMIYGHRAGPLMSGVHVVPFPYCHHCRDVDAPCRNAERTTCCLEPVRQLELLLRQRVDASEVAAVIIEPVLGEGGYVPAPPEYLRALREVCTRHDILLVADEVQTGFGRTGSWFATDHTPDFAPDVLVFAKGLANGMPLSGIASTHALMSRQPVGGIGGTYAGNAVSCAAAGAVIDVMSEPGFFEHAAARSAQMFTAMRELKQRTPQISDVRGVGLMMGIEFDHARVPKGTAAAVSARCLEKGLLVLTCSTFETLRFIPPCNVSADEVQLACSMFADAVTEHFQQ